MVGTYHRKRIGVGSGFRVPLHGDLSRRASVWAIVAWLTGLVGAHGPTCVLLVGSDSDQASISWELALSTALFHLVFRCMVVVAAVVEMTVVVGGFRDGDEADNGGDV